MANKKFTDLTAADVITGAEILALVQSGNSRKAALTAIKAYFDTLYAPVSTTITAPVAWTPTFTGFGTVSAVTAYSWRVGSLLHYEIRFTAGTTTATEARISLGFNGVDGSVTSASTYPTLQICGYGVGSTDLVYYAPLIEASKTYMCMGYLLPSSTAGLNKLNGNVTVTIGSSMSIAGSVRIQGW